jgi:hypothetical protein
MVKLEGHLGRMPFQTSPGDQMADFDRRTLIAGALSAGLLPSLARAAVPAVPPALHFAILRNGKPFGKYDVALASSGDTMTVTSDVAMAMTISGLRVFNYTLHCVEVWKGGQFISLESQSVRDSERTTLSAARGNLGITIRNKLGPQLLPLNANPLTHWNPAVLNGMLFNPQDGVLLDLKAQPPVRDMVTLANGTKLAANHWALRGQSPIDDWYDDAGVWAGLRAIFPDKSIVEYRRV